MRKVMVGFLLIFCMGATVDFNTDVEHFEVTVNTVTLKGTTTYFRPATKEEKTDREVDIEVDRIYKERISERRARGINWGGSPLTDTEKQYIRKDIEDLAIERNP